ncbi:MAG: cysteine--tRNA ligase [Deltaproteobacteria bacterium]|jgi:cysteinyl-tRNA synthetase|nr:cysteine--tRNA ligase [Deltaproteobacteria bacterium]MCL5879642.1 cysteine--tRNA ligase [Deltaproteobacteria bacterium]MDA8304099.1 cysteine--tRNA ligase [Deltaproteobacteria bacterium]
MNKNNKLYIYNTIASSKELFKPIEGNRVLMYVCGITAYDLSHIGHARAYITFDIIYRYLKRLGYDVIYVRNFTDIDDKIIKRANEENTAVSSISAKYIDEYHKDMNALSVLPPTYEPRATETIKEMIDLIKGLIDKGHAYEKDGDVFFRVNSYKGYGKLSHKNIGELLAGARIPLNEEKENLLDFALWKRSKQGEPSWDSPWGKGRPGWHIECSAMSMKFLGETIDIHGGGSDLIFPHHENEIAQSESYTGKKFVNYWIHNGFVNINNEKMSKSLKNFITVRDLLERYHPEVIRLFFMFTHYRSFIDFSFEGLESAKHSLMRLYQAINLYKGFKDKVDKGNIKINYLNRETEEIKDFNNDFYDAMNDDFNTPSALSVIFNLVRKINKIINDSLLSGFINHNDLNFLDEALLFISLVSDIFGILKANPELFIETNLKDISKISLTEEEIQAFIEKRNMLRQKREYKMADEIRNMLLEKGVLLEDSNYGTTFKIIN